MAPSGSRSVTRGCKRVLHWIPVLFIGVIVAWSYYAYVVQLCIESVENVGEKIVYLLAYHVFFLMFAWAYWQTIFTKPMHPLKEFHLSYSDKELMDRADRGESQQEILKRIIKDLPVYTRTMSGAIRFCDRCILVKPDRCHHCSVCDKCILKMDHHCPWVNNCVGFSNYKYFMLFLAYSLLYCLFITATDLQYFIKFWLSGLPDTQAKFHIMFLFFAAAMFSVSLAALFSYHCWLVCKNRSTLEAVRAPAFRHGPDKNGFSLGIDKNFRQVFGDEMKYWPVPVFSSLGDGCSFPTCLVNQDPEQPATPPSHSPPNTSVEEPQHQHQYEQHQHQHPHPHPPHPHHQHHQQHQQHQQQQFPAKPLRESQSRLLSSSESWREGLSGAAEHRESRTGTPNPAMTIENEH